MKQEKVKDPASPLCPNPSKNDFTGHWIWLPDEANYTPRNSYVYFRKTFRAQGPLVIDIAADTFYDLFIDGRRVDRGTAVSEIAYKIVDTHIIHVTHGEHTIGVIVHHFGEVCATAMKSRPGLFVEMTAESGEKIVTDSGWKALPATAYEQDLPCMMSHFSFYEMCDCRKIPTEWTTATFDDSGWYNAKVLGETDRIPWIRMIPRDIPLLTTTSISAEQVLCHGTYHAGSNKSAEEHLTVAVEMASRKRTLQPMRTHTLPFCMAGKNQDVFAVIDFGREVTGHVRLGITGAEPGRQVDIGYDEIVDKNGIPNPRRTYVHFADRYLLHEHQNAIEIFNARGFRYLMIDVSAGKADFVLTRVDIDERTYPVEKTGSFRCSDPVLESLYQTSLTTLRLCMLDSFVDCPSRERVMWMDSYLEGIFSSYGMGMTRLWRRALYLFAQNPCRQGVLAGAVKGFAPCDTEPMLMSYTMYYVCSVADYLQHSGDVQTCRALWPIVLKQMDVLKTFEIESELLGDQWPGWGTFLDWSAMDAGGISAGNNAIYIKMHQKAASLAHELKNNSLAKPLREKSERLIQAFHERFWIEEEGLFADAVYDGKPGSVRSQLTNFMAIWAGVVDHQQGRLLVERITNKDRLLPRTKGDFRLKKDFTPQTGGVVPIGTPGLGFLATTVMFTLGMADEAIDYLKENWPGIAVNGTFAEHFVFDANTSYCQGWSAGPLALLPRFILGVRPISPGWTEIAIDPQPGPLDWAEGTIPTPHGDIFVSWKQVAGSPEVTFKVPEGVTVINR